MTTVRTAVAALLGVVVGAAAMVGLQQAPADDTRPHAETAPATPSPAPVKTTTAATSRLLLLWTPGGLPQPLIRRVRELPQASALTVVGGGRAELTASFDGDGRVIEQLDGGFVVPLDAMTFDRRTYPAFLPSSVAGLFRRLGDDEVVLGRTAAQLRGVEAGGALELSGDRSFTVAGVVDDAIIGAAEIAIAGDTLDGLLPRYALLHHSGDRAAMEEAIREAAPPGTPARVRAAGETPYLRHGDAVLPQVTIKQEFGEFSYRPGDGREFTQDPGWAGDHIVTVEMPVLGWVTCHRAIVQPLRSAMTELSEQGLGWLIDPDDFGGCYNPRLTSAKDGDSASRHAWGVALDINAGRNPYGSSGDQDPRLVETLARWGFSWGGEWLVPDPAHFEYTGDAS